MADTYGYRENYCVSAFMNKVFLLGSRYKEPSYYCLLNDKKSAQKVWFKDLVYKGTFRLSSRTPHAYKISYELIDLFFFFI